MSRYHSYLNTARSIITSYKGEMPLSAYLKNFFSKEKKYGSKDRRSIAGLCYNYYRLGFADTHQSLDERIIRSSYICSEDDNAVVENLQPVLHKSIHLSIAEKLKIADINASAIFPFADGLSEGINHQEFSKSFLVQPFVFVRIRPAKKNIVHAKLAAANIAYNEVDHNTLSFAGNIKLADVLFINKEVVIQDLNSQRVGELILEGEYTKPTKVWDCCAASGGKSIMVVDLLSNVELTVSDVRESIIKNLQSRFKEAGINRYKSFTTDIANDELLKEHVKSNFDLVICDVPCSGSGTWSRTPEQMVFFNPGEIVRYATLQKKIALNSSKYISNNGYFIYITCSVFKKENEEVVEYIEANTQLTLVEKRLLTGYNERADTMFAALFKAAD